MSTLLDQIQRSVTSVAKGLGVTLKNYGREKTTLNYPDEKPILAERYRGLHGLTLDPATGEENCIGCMACARVCPDNLISMTLEKREGHKGRYPVNFQIDLNPCCFCGLCSEVCPTPYKALVMTHDFELAGESRADLVLTKDKLMFYARRDQVQSGDLPLEYPMLSKEQRDDLPLLDEAAQQQVAAAFNVQEAVAIVNPLNAKPRAPKPAPPKAEPPPKTQAAWLATQAAKPQDTPDSSLIPHPSSLVPQGSALMPHGSGEAPVEPDYSGMERVERSKAKAAYIKAKRAYDETQAAKPPPAVTQDSSLIPHPSSLVPQDSALSTQHSPQAPVEPDYTGMERVERSRAKAAYIKAKRAYDETQSANPAPAVTQDSSLPPSLVSQDSALSTQHLPEAPVEPDYTGMERVERSRAKAAYIKAKRAYDEAQAAKPPPPPPVTQASWLMAQASEPPVEPDYTGMERVERSKAKAAYIKAKRAYDEAQAANPAAAVTQDSSLIPHPSSLVPQASGLMAHGSEVVPLATTEGAREALMSAIGRTGIAEFGSGHDAGMAAEAEGLSPETQRALAGVSGSP